MKKNIIDIEKVIEYIELHLDGKLDLEQVSEASRYSKYHLHRMFADTVGLTIHDYVQRRQLTEAAKLLVFSDKPIIDVALICGYESQQAFSTAFKSMYKKPPAEYREKREFYPLQLRFTLSKKVSEKVFVKDDISLAEHSDIDDWMNMMRLVIDGYPVMNEADYLKEIVKCIDERRALVLKDGDIMIGVMAFSYESGSIEFFGIHPQYRRSSLHKLFLEVLMDNYLSGKEISMTTFREGDKADTGYREKLKQMGFAERELLTEFGYPTQRFVYVPGEKEKSECLKK